METTYRFERRDARATTHKQFELQHTHRNTQQTHYKLTDTDSSDEMQRQQHTNNLLCNALTATHCKHTANTLQHTDSSDEMQEQQNTHKITLQHTANTLQIHCRHTANTLQTHCKHTANTLQTHCKHTATCRFERREEARRHTNHLHGNTLTATRCKTLQLAATYRFERRDAIFGGFFAELVIAATCVGKLHTRYFALHESLLYARL